MPDKLRVDLSGAPQTMLATLYAKALDADLPNPILGDRLAKDIVDRIDYHWTQTSITPANSPSVTDPAWLTEIPTDRPVLVIAEGLTMYLTRDDGVALLRRVIERFPSGELHFDAFSRLGIRSQWANAVVRRAGARLHWGVDGPDDIVDAVPGVRLLAWVSPFDSPTFRDVAWYYRVMAGDVAAAAAALHGPVPPLRLLTKKRAGRRLLRTIHRTRPGKQTF